MEQPVQLKLNAYEAAYLAKGKNHVVDTAIASLVQKQYVIVDTEKRMLALKKSVEELSNPIERAVADAIALDGNIANIRSAAIQATDNVRERLRELGLLVNQKQSFNVKTYPTILIAGLLGLGIAKISVGISRHKPVGYLTIMCIFVGFIALWFWLSSTHRSRYGDRILQELHTQTQSLTATSSTDPKLIVAFALLGTTVLPNDMFADLKKVLTPVSSSTSSSSGCGGSSSSCGSSCGGGCGGCGGG